MYQTSLIKPEWLTLAKNTKAMQIFENQNGLSSFIMWTEERGIPKLIIKKIFENQRDVEINSSECVLGIWHLHSSDVPGQCMLSEYCEGPHTEFWFGKSS